jgi:hypothetical protein
MTDYLLQVHSGGSHHPPALKVGQAGSLTIWVAGYQPAPRGRVEQDGILLTWKWVSSQEIPRELSMFHSAASVV